METALSRTMFVGRGWVALVGVAAAGLVLAGALVYLVSENPGGQATVVKPVAPGGASATSVTGVVRETGYELPQGEQTASGLPMRNVKLIVTGTSAQGATVVRHLQADGQGRFKLSLPNGHYRIYAIAYGPANVPLARQPHSTITVRHERPVHVRLTVSTI